MRAVFVAAAVLALAVIAPAASAGPVTVGLPCTGFTLGADQGEYVCVTPKDPECIVRLVHITIAGPMEVCLVPAP